MYFKKSLSVITILVFSFVFCLAVAISGARAQSRTGDQSGEIVEGDSGTGGGMEDGERSGSFYESSSQTGAYGQVWNQFRYGPDYGFGEVGEGISSYNPITGEYYEYKVTGIGQGTVPAAVYGGMFSEFANVSYGPYAFGGTNKVNPTPGMNTQQYISGNAFGQGVSMQSGRPDPVASVGFGLLGNQNTASMGLALLLQGSLASGAAYPGGGFTGSGLGTSLGGSFGLGGYPLAGISGGYLPTTQYAPQAYNPAYAQQANPYYGQQQVNPYYGQQQVNPYYGQQQVNPYYGQQQVNPYYGQQISPSYYPY